MKIAIIGSGISGVSTAYYLRKYGYDVTLFEAGNYFGGHTNTIDIEIDGRTIPIDTGFLVHNDRTYPNLIDFFEELDIETHPSDMSFSVKREGDGIMWAGTNLATVFAQFKNLFSPRFYRFLFSVLRFNRNSEHYLELTKKDMGMSLGQLLDRYGYSEDFRNWYLLPMGGCIWSTPTDKMLDFPAYTFIRFCINHGLLQITDRPQWKTVVGGCRIYVKKALENIDKKYLNEAIEKTSIVGDKVIVKTKQREEVFDYCFHCAHPPEIVKYLDGENRAKELLKNFDYQQNLAVLHWDKSILPVKRAWSSWNYLSNHNTDGEDAVSVSYLINMLQPIATETPILVTLNPVTEIDKNKIFREIKYEHPLFDDKAVSSQEKIHALQGEDNMFYAGAWLRYGFHEDGILSAKRALLKFFEKVGKCPEDFKVL